MKKFRFYYIVIVLMLSMVLPMHAADKFLFLPETELKIDLNPGQNEHKTYFSIQNITSKELGINMFALPLEESEKKILARFFFMSEGREARHDTLILKAGEIRDVPIKIKNINIFGQYNGKIEVRAKNALPDSSFLISKVLPVVVSKKPVASIEVIGLTDGILEWTMDKPMQQIFSIRLKNPADGIFRKIRCNKFILRSGQKNVTAKIVNQMPIIFEPLHEEQVEVTIKNLSSGTYRGTLIIQDDTNEHFHTQVPIRLINPHLKWLDLFKGNNLLLIILVFSGAACSLLMTKSLPISVQKKKNRKKISELTERIQSVTRFEPMLDNKLTVELIRAETMNKNTKIWTPTATERFEKINEIIDKVYRYFTIREKISVLHIRIQKLQDLPFSFINDATRALKMADVHLATDRPEAAEAIVNETEKLVIDFQNREGSGKQRFEVFVTKFFEDVETLLTILEKEELNEELSKEEFFKDLKNTLKKHYEKLKPDKTKVESHRLKEIDLLYNRLKLYCEYLLNRKITKLDSNSLNQAKEKIFDLLKLDTYEELQEAEMHVKAIRRNVTDDLIIKAIKDKKYRIETIPSDPFVNDVIKFDLVFEDKKIDQCVLTKQFRIVWNFNDNTRGCEGKKVIHYFKRTGSFILLRKWCRRNSRHILKKSDYWKIFKTMNVMAIVCTGKDEFSSKTIELKIKEPLENIYRTRITILDVVGFGLTFVLSCLIAMSSAFNEGASFTALKSFLTPFLLGYGLEISKEQILKESKK